MHKNFLNVFICVTVQLLLAANYTVKYAINVYLLYFVFFCVY